MSEIKAFSSLLYPGLAHTHHPPYPCCIASKMYKIQTRTKGKNAMRNIQEAVRPGHYISVDQMECSTPGFIAQLKGRLTKKRYIVSTVYVNPFLDLTYIRNQESTTSTETLISKHAFGAFSREKVRGAAYYSFTFLFPVIFQSFIIFTINRGSMSSSKNLMEKY